MHRLYNGLLALNDAGLTLFHNVRDGAEKLARECDDSDLDLRDARSVALDAVNSAFADQITERALRLQKQDDVQKRKDKGQ